jgi:medium-chain acyl-[acyl-carrier-protein] hydrolase
MSSLFTANPWLSGVRPNPRARLRLFCFPNAGAGASVFRGWQDLLPLVQVCPVQLPGRETRLAEAAFTRIEPLVQALTEGLRPELGEPFAFLGHSMGGLLAFELAHQLRQAGAAGPLHLVVAGRPAPHMPRKLPQMHDLPDDEFRKELRELGGTPPAVLEHEELMQLLLPVLRADFTVCETYRCPARPPLACPLSAFGGREDDTVPEEDLAGWRQYTTGPFALHILPGDHFFLHTSRARFVELLAGALRPAAAW